MEYNLDVIVYGTKQLERLVDGFGTLGVEINTTVEMDNGAFGVECGYRLWSDDLISAVDRLVNDIGGTTNWSE